MEIELTKHARKRLKERKIQLTQIRATVLAPDKWFYGEEGEINTRRKTTPMKIEYDREADAAYLRLSQKKPERSIEVSKYVIIDVDDNGQPVGIEVLFASKTLQDFTPWFSLSEAAEYLGFSEVTLRRWVKAKKIPAYKIGRAYQFKKEDLDRFIEKHKVSA